MTLFTDKHWSMIHMMMEMKQNIPMQKIFDKGWVHIFFHLLTASSVSLSMCWSNESWILIWLLTALLPAKHFRQVNMKSPYSKMDPFDTSKKCGFLHTVERKKRKKFFSHTAGSLGTSVPGVSGHVACVRFSFVLPSALPNMSHPPTHEVLVECV